MINTAEQVIDALRQLTAPERRRVRDWLSGPADNASVAPNGNREKMDRFNRSMAWIDQNRDEYLGMWVALDGDTLLAFGKDGKMVRAQASLTYSGAPLMHLVTLSETLPFAGID